MKTKIHNQPPSAPARLLFPHGVEALETRRLYRPVGDLELREIALAKYRRFPPRLRQQEFFYPVCHEHYAAQIAEDWNAKHAGVGFVTRFRVLSEFLARYSVHRVGSHIHEEYWIPAVDLDAFNDAIVGEIEVVRVFVA